MDFTRPLIVGHYGLCFTRHIWPLCDNVTSFDKSPCLTTNPDNCTSLVFAAGTHTKPHKCVDINS